MNKSGNIIDDKSPFAVFVLSHTKDNLVAATTRAKDNNEEGRIGLPGGKVDPNENPVDAAYRESYEEGWHIENINPTPIHKDYINGKLIWWFMGYNPTKLNTYKEMHRIQPIEVTKEEISNSGYGNEFIAGLFENKLKNIINEELFESFNKSESIINESFNTELNKLNKYGYKLIDKQEINNYILFLVREPHEGIYEIGITSNDRDFTTSSSQQKISGSGEGKEFSTASGFKSVIGDWINKYTPIYVGSLNKNKTTKYHNILNRLGFNVGKINYDQPVVMQGNEVFPESWNFVLSEDFKIKNIVNEELSELLNEATATEIWEKYYNKIPEETFYQIIKADPTSKPENDKMGKFSKWLLNLFVKNRLRIEDLYKATDYLKKFITLNKYLSKKDILKYNSLPELYAELKKLDNRKQIDVFDAKGNELINSGEIDLFYEDDKWIILIPNTLKASCHFGSDAWCTTKPDHFKNYNEDGNLYMFILKQNIDIKYQLYLQGDAQFMDVNDDDANITEIIPENLFKMILEKEGFQYERVDLSKENYEKHMELINDYYCERRSEIPKRIILNVLEGTYHVDLYEIDFDGWIKEYIYYVRDEINKTLINRNIDIDTVTYNDEIISDLSDDDFVDYLQEEHDDIYENLIDIVRFAAEGTYYDNFHKEIIDGIEGFDYDDYKHNALRFGLTVDEDSCIEVDEPQYGFDYSPTSKTFKEHFNNYYQFP